MSKHWSPDDDLARIRDAQPKRRREAKEAAAAAKARAKAAEEAAKAPPPPADLTAKANIPSD